MCLDWFSVAACLQLEFEGAQRRCLHEANLIHLATYRHREAPTISAMESPLAGGGAQRAGVFGAEPEELLPFAHCVAVHPRKLHTTKVIGPLVTGVRRWIRARCTFCTRSSWERIQLSVFDRLNTYWSQKPLGVSSQDS